MSIRKKHIDNKTSYGPNKYYLYVKIHPKTSLKYLGRTCQKPTVYSGSGKHWERHLKKHGKEHTTMVIGIYPNLETLSEAGLYYSKLWDVVKSKKWANLCEEDGNNETKGWSHLTSEMRTANGKKGGAKGGSIMGPKSRDLKIGLHGLTKEQRVKNASIGGKASAANRRADPERDLKYREGRRQWMLANNPTRGVKHTEQALAKMRARKGKMTWVTNGVINRQAYKTELDAWFENGYVLGRTVTKGLYIWMNDGSINSKVLKTSMDSWLNKGFRPGRTDVWKLKKQQHPNKGGWGKRK
jgi:hypothetical protein